MYNTLQTYVLLNEQCVFSFECLEKNSPTSVSTASYVTHSPMCCRTMIPFDHLVSEKFSQD